MLIILEDNTQLADRSVLTAYLRKKGADPVFLPTQNALVISGVKLHESLEQFTFIKRIIEIETPFQLASLQYKKTTKFEVNGVMMGSEYANIIAGPCSVESEKQIFETAAFLKENHIKFIRGGAFKPRTSPYSFRGLGTDGLKLIHEAARQYGLSVVTELMDLSLLEDVMAYTDIIQIGSRNMANFYLLAELGKVDKPVMLKRGMQAKVNEWLLAADYIMSGGNEKIILCERGIRSFDPMSRNVLDLGVVPLVQSLSHLPVIVDPSHGTGDSRFVNTMATAAMVAGANGLMVEIHPDPSKALSDSKQALSFDQFSALLQQIELVKPAIHKPIDAIYSLQA